MNTSGVVLIIAGAWVLCQVLGGNALGRLGITGQTAQSPGAALGGAVGGAIQGAGPIIAGGGATGGTG